MTGTWSSLAPALALLVLLAALAWGVQWLRRRTQPQGGDGAALRVVSQLMVGPQQRVVVIELDGPGGVVQLTLGVTPQHVRTLHSQAVAPARRAPHAAAGHGATPGLPAYADVARAAAAHPAADPPAGPPTGAAR